MIGCVSMKNQERRHKAQGPKVRGTPSETPLEKEQERRNSEQERNKKEETGNKKASSFKFQV